MIVRRLVLKVIHARILTVISKVHQHMQQVWAR